MSVGGIETRVEEDYPEYLHDESRRTGVADSISFPATEEALCSVLASMNAAGTSVTVQGARTGITGGAVPDGGHIINLSRMNRITTLRRDMASDTFILTVQPGVLLADVSGALKSLEFDTSEWSDDSIAALGDLKGLGRYFFSPDPTEDSASIGGMVSCNASGARSFFYGPTRKHISRIRVALIDGSMFDLPRGCVFASKRHFRLSTDVRTVEGDLPSYSMPDVKNAAGYFIEDDMDMIDLFIGAEGTLGVITEIDIILHRLPSEMWGVMTFFESEESAIRFVEAVQQSDDDPVAVELFDKNALGLLKRQREVNAAFQELPEPPDGDHTAIYVEYHGTDADEVENAVLSMSQLMVDCDGDEDATWVVTNEREMVRLKSFRHAVPEAVNLLIDERRKEYPELTKLGTDQAVPPSHLRELLALYHDGLLSADLEYVIFGHIGDGHVHVNIIPANPDEYANGKALYRAWSEAVIDMGGTVSAEHGIGKLKTDLLLAMYGQDGVSEMVATKRLFDHAMLLNRGNLFIGDR